MLRQNLAIPGWRRAAISLAAFALFSAHVAAAPRITEVMNSAPPRVQQGEKLLMLVEGLVPPVRVFFSDGTSPSIEATSVLCDLDRGFVVAQVPAGAQTGNLKVTADGVDSPLHYVRVEPGVFDSGSGVAQGTVVGPGGPVSGVLLALLRPTACDDTDFVDFAATDALGEFELWGPEGDYFILGFPPVLAGLAPGAAEVTLGESPATVEVALAAATTVEGRVVSASLPSTGIASARVDFEGEFGYETRLTDAGGYFSVVLPPGDVDILTAPSPPDHFARDERSVTIETTSPQSLADIELASGVRIFGFVRRSRDGSPVPGAEVDAREMYTCCDDVDRKRSSGDGSFSLVLPADTTYLMYATVDRDAPLTDAQLFGIAVGTEDVRQDVELGDAGAITGRVFHAQTGDPVEELNVNAFVVPYDSLTLANSRTCSDGSYHLRVPPSAVGYVAAAAFYEVTGFVPVAWNGTETGTFYPCEGTTIPVPDLSTVVSDIDLRVHPGPASVYGTIRSQDSGCSETVDETLWMFVDDGGEHACGLGFPDWTVSPGTYRVLGLPGDSLVPGLRVCHPGTPEGGAQCWNVERPPAYDPVFVPAGGERNDIDFCLGARPTTEVTGLLAAKGPGVATFSWTATEDPYQSRYRLRGAMSARPLVGEGSFPDDPAFDVVWEGTSPSAEIDANDPHVFFLVTNVGSTGVEGPSGSYSP